MKLESLRFKSVEESIKRFDDAVPECPIHNSDTTVLIVSPDADDIGPVVVVCASCGKHMLEQSYGYWIDV